MRKREGFLKRFLIALLITTVVANIYAVIVTMFFNSLVVFYITMVLIMVPLIVWAVPYVELGMSPRQFFRNNRFRQKDSDA